MAALSSAHSLFERARLRGSGANKDLFVNGEEVRKKLQPSTQGNYSRALALWQEYEVRNPGATPTSIETSKDFARIIAYGIEGKHDDPNACLTSVVQTYKNFTAGWRWTGHEKIDDRVTLTTSNFIKDHIQKELNLARRKRKRCYGTMIHFLHLGTQLWQNDWHMYERPGIRVDVWVEIQLNVFTSARVGEFLESTCRAGSGRGLYYRDITFTVFRNEHGNAEFAMQVVKDAKGMTFTPHKRLEHSLHEGLEPRPLFCNPILTHLAIFIAKNAFRDYKTMEQLLNIKPPEDEMFHLEWDSHVLNSPLYQRKDGKTDTAQVFSRRLRDLGVRAGYSLPPTIHDFRAEGLHLIDKLYTSAQRMRHGGHTDENTYNDFYAPQNPGTDGQGAYFGDTLRTIVNDRFRAMTLSRNPELWQSLPAEKQNALERSPEFIALEEELETLSLESKDGSTARDRRKELHAQKRKLIAEELRKFQKLQPRKLSSKADKSDLTGHHRSRFLYVCDLMPIRRRLASNLFSAVSIRSDTGRAVLRDMIDLYRQETEVAFRPGLEPDKCHCAAERSREIDRKPAAQRWKHIYGCYKTSLRARHGFAELCFSCNKWTTCQEEWEGHCQAHLDILEMIPIQCNPFTHGGCLACPGHCPWCLGDVTLPAATRMRQFPDRAEWQVHIDRHDEDLGDGKAPICPHPGKRCAEALGSVQELKFHLQDVHCVVIRKGVKRSRSESEVDTRPRKIKSSGDANNRDLGLRTVACVERMYQFVDEAARLRSRKTARESTTSSIMSKRSTQSPDWSAETPPSSTCSDELDKIDPRLLDEATPSSIRSSSDDAIEVVDLPSLDEEMTMPLDGEDPPKDTITTQNNSPPVRDMHDKDHPPTLKFYDTSLDKASSSPQSPFYLEEAVLPPVRTEDNSPSNPQINSASSPDDYGDDSIRESRARQQGPECSPIASVPVIHDETADVDIEDVLKRRTRLLV